MAYGAGTDISFSLVVDDDGFKAKFRGNAGLGGGFSVKGGETKARGGFVIKDKANGTGAEPAV